MINIHDLADRQLKVRMMDEAAGISKKRDGHILHYKTVYAMGTEFVHLFKRKPNSIMTVVLTVRRIQSA